MDGIAWIRDAVVPLAEATVPLADRGHLLGDGVFETLRVTAGRPFRPQAHMDRMRHGVRSIGLDAEIVDDVERAIQQTIAAGEDAFGSELYVRAQVTTGTMQEFLESEGGPTISVVCKKFQPYPMRHYSRGVHAVLAPQRKDSRDPLATVKSTSFAGYLAARRFALGKTAHDGLLRNEHGRLAEASTSNIFAVCGDLIHAPGPSEGALDGVTRAAVLELVEDTGMEWMDLLDVHALESADEAFLTNTIGGIIPLTRFNDVPIGTGEKGTLTSRLQASLAALVAAS